MITLIIIIGTCIFSISAFNKPELMYKYQFNAYQIIHRKEWYRLITHAFLHANWEHLIFNMLVLYFFGDAVEQLLGMYFNSPIFLYISLYVSAIIISSLYSLIKHKDNFAYNALGASGAVSAITFCFIFFRPLDTLRLYFAIPIKAIIFAVLYLAYSWYMGKKNIDNIGHDAHFYGALFGFVFPLFINPKLIQIFIYEIQSYF